MSESEPPNMDNVGKKRTFTTITTTANNLIKKCQKAAEEDKLAILVQGLEAATREYLSIMLEKLDLTEIITHSPKGKFLYELDLAKLFSPEEKEVEEVTVRMIFDWETVSLGFYLFTMFFKIVSLLEALRVDIGEVKELVHQVEPEEKPTKSVNLDSFKRLQDKVKSHGDLLTRLKNREE